MSEGRAEACSPCKFGPRDQPKTPVGSQVSRYKCPRVCMRGGNRSVWRGGPGEGRKWGPLSRGERIECSPIPAWYYNHQHRCLQARIALQSQPKWHQYAMCRSGGEGRAETCSPLLAGVVTSAGHCRRSTALQIRSVAPYGTSVPKWGVCQTFGQWVK